MGQKRTQNILDKKIGTYLAGFEKDVLAKIDERLTDRLDKITATEKELKTSLEKSVQIVEKSQRAAERYQWNITLQDLLFGVIGGAIGALVVLIGQSFL